MAIGARAFFEQTRDAVRRLDDVHALIMSGCDDWRPDGGRGSGIGDPTAAKAIRNVDVLADKLEALRAEEKELTNTIGEALAIIEGVRHGLGEQYAVLLEARYIDCWDWGRIYDVSEVKRSNGYNLLGVAFDWIDSIGIARVLRGEYEL